MNYYDTLINQIEDGKKIKKRFTNKYLSSLSQCIGGVQKSRYYLIGADPGVGKTTLTDQLLLDILIDLYENGGELDVEIHYWSLELAVEVKLLKWVSYKMWVDKGAPMNPDLLTSGQLHPKIEEAIRTDYKPFLDFLQTKIKFYTKGSVKSINDSLNQVVRDNGQIINGKYVEHNPNCIVLSVIDHVGLLEEANRPKAIELLSKQAVGFRNNYYITSMHVQQFNRTANSVERQKFNPAPQRDDFKDTSTTFESCDVALGIINPAAYNNDTFKQYDLTKFDKASFRSIHVMKNRYGRFPASSSVGLYGVTGWFFELPATITDQDYNIINDYKALHKQYAI